MTNSAVNPNPRTFNQEVFSFWPALQSFCYLSLSFQAHLAIESGQHCQIWVKAVEHERKITSNVPSVGETKDIVQFLIRRQMQIKNINTCRWCDRIILTWYLSRVSEPPLYFSYLDMKNNRWLYCNVWNITQWPYYDVMVTSSWLWLQSTTS